MSSLSGQAAIPQIEGYQLLRRIGSGSYGAVWLARGTQGRYCAVKIIHRSDFENDRPFDREYQGMQKFTPVSRQHASQVAILDVGRKEREGFFFYAMELADNAAAEPGAIGAIPDEFDPQTYQPKTLKSVLGRAGRLSVGDAVQIGLALATALDHLHRHGLVHRDIKPSNVIFVNGVPKLADIGLVTDMEATISYVGTEGFLPPEGPGTPLADLYSLGKVLYEISTGLDRLEFPELPSLTEAAAASEDLMELNLVFLKACQNDPARRYQSARELSADLALLQAGKSLRRSRQLEHRLSQGKKASAAVILLVLLIGGGFYAAERNRLLRAREEARQRTRDQAVAEKVAQETRSRLAASFVVQAEQAWRAGDHYAALLWLDEASAEESLPSRQEALRRRADALGRTLPAVSRIVLAEEAIRWVDFSGDGSRMVAVSPGRAARRWSMNDPQEPPLELPASCRGAAVAADENAKTVAVWCLDGQIRIWREERAQPDVLSMASPVSAVEFHLPDRRILSGHENGKVVWWDTANGRPRLEVDLDEPVASVSASPEGRWIAALGAQGRGKVWEVDSGAERVFGAKNVSSPGLMVWQPTGRRLAWVEGNHVAIWNLSLPEPSPVRMFHDAPITGLSFSPDGTTIATGCQDGSLRAWNAVTGRLRWRRQAAPEAEPVTNLAFHPDARSLATISDRRWQLWSAESGQVWSPPLIFGASIHKFAFAQDGRRAVIGAGDGTARVVEIPPLPLALVSQEKDLPAFLDSPDSRLKTEGTASWPERRLWARMWAGRDLDSEGRLRPLNRTEWEFLLAESKNHSAATSLDPAAAGSEWHEQAARYCEAGGAWFGAWFHWERLTNDCEASKADMARAQADGARIKHGQSAIDDGDKERQRAGIPARLAEATPNHIDLSSWYNAALDRSWFPTNVIAFGNDLAALPRGLVSLDGVSFEVRGVVQLSGAAMEDIGGLFPRETPKLPLPEICRELHFLQGLSGDAWVGTHVGGYRVHYADGTQRDIRLVYGENIRDWWFREHQPELTPRALIAWHGQNDASRQVGLAVRLYHLQWNNPEPERPVSHVSFYSTMEKPAPFLVALTAGP